MSRTVRLAACLLGLSLAFAGTAKADGYPPFYGYSDYFGGPRIYWTPDNTIHQVTKPVSVEHSLGTRTYYRGGPFWRYEYNSTGFGRAERAPRRTVLRRKG